MRANAVNGIRGKSHQLSTSQQFDGTPNCPRIVDRKASGFGAYP
jgi:hypothetical protein